MINLKDFAALTSNTNNQNTTSRPKRAIAANLKLRSFEALNTSLVSFVHQMVEDRGVVVDEGQYQVTNEEISVMLRTTFNALNGPDLTMNKDQALAAVEQVVESLQTVAPKGKVKA